MDSDETLWIPRKISKNLKKCVQRQRLALLEFVGNLLSGSAQWYAYQKAVLEIVIATALDGFDCGTWINGQKLDDLCFADDISLQAENNYSLQQMVDSRPTAKIRQEDGNAD